MAVKDFAVLFHKMKKAVEFNLKFFLFLFLAICLLAIIHVVIVSEVLGQQIEEIHLDYGVSVGEGPRYYGVEYGWIDQDKSLFIKRLKRLNANVVRVQISQEVFEPFNDNDDPNYSQIDFSVKATVDRQKGKTLTYEKMFRTLAKKFPEMQFQVNVWLCARWNATDSNGYSGLGGAYPPSDYAEHHEFVKALAQWLVNICGISPHLLSFTFINEPNIAGFFVGTQSDLARMAQETRAALDEVSPLIRMGGLDEVNGTAWSDQFYQYNWPNWNDVLTTHVYRQGVNTVWVGLQTQIIQLAQYGPVWVTEFADTNNGSPDGKMDFSTRDAALGFSELLGRLWPSGIDGIIHFRFSDTYADFLGGWVGHGLFADSRGTHANGIPYKPFPSYFLFANIYRELGGAKIVRTDSPKDLIVVGAKKTYGSKNKVVIFVTNPTSDQREIKFVMDNLPFKRMRIKLFDNLASYKPTRVIKTLDKELAFNAIFPARSSYLFVAQLY